MGEGQNDREQHPRMLAVCDGFGRRRVLEPLQPRPRLEPIEDLASFVEHRVGLDASPVTVMLSATVASLRVKLRIADSPTPSRTPSLVNAPNATSSALMV